MVYDELRTHIIHSIESISGENHIVDAEDGQSFFIDSYTEAYSGRITYWRDGAIHLEVIDGATAKTMYNYHAQVITIDEFQNIVALYATYLAR
jgi:hypothetical protein